MKKYEIVKMKTLFGQEFEMVEKKNEREEGHVHDPVSCMRARGLKCKCHHCNRVLHGIVWKRKIEKLDRYMEQEKDAFFESIIPNLYEANKALEALP